MSNQKPIQSPTVWNGGVNVAQIGTSSEESDPSSGRTPTLAQQARSLANQEYDKQFDFLTDDIKKRVLANATEKKLAYDIKAKIGNQFRVEVQTEVVSRITAWLRSEGFNPVKTVAEYRIEKGRTLNKHSDEYARYSSETFLLEW